MADSHPPLHEYVVVSKFLKLHLVHKALLLLRMGFFVSFLCYRLSSCLHDFNPLSFVALACEGLLGTCAALLCLFAKWFLVERQTHPDRLTLRRSDVDQGRDFPVPPVDVFVTTADPLKEPPLMTMNTVLSVLAVDYPVDKTACYVSDDGGSLLTFWALKETAKFAQKWVPFCRTFRVEPRAPAAYFTGKAATDAKERGFKNEFENMKKEYEVFQRRMSSAVEYHKGIPERHELVLDGLSATAWSANDPRNHPGIFQIIQYKPGIVDGDAVPLLAYISREKRPQQKHQFKAGAMNALTRVSGILTNAPFILNLDCDMYVNNSKAIYHAMCFFMDPEINKELAFVQFPQCFGGLDDDDVYGNRLATVMEIALKAMDGVQGPPYCGTGCVHKREALYGQEPMGVKGEETILLSDYEKSRTKFGRSSALIVACTKAVLTSDNEVSVSSMERDSLLQQANEVVSCTYEEGTHWGREVGWIYGSTVEDVLTGLKIHSRGWKSVYCTPSPPAFVGSAPTTSEDVLNTRKRWSTGILEILLFCRESPILFLHSKALSGLQRIIYLYHFLVLLTCLPMFTYALLPSVSLITGRPLLPKVYDPAIVLPISLFLLNYGIPYYENTLVGVGMKGWWNSERLEAIVLVSSSLCAAGEVLLKMMGIWETSFVVTPKIDKEASNNDESSRGGFEVKSKSGLFVAPTVLVVVNVLGALTYILLLCIRTGRVMEGEGIAEAACALWVLFVLWPFTKGLIMSLCSFGQQGLPTSTILYAFLIASLLLLLLLLFLS